MSQIIRANRHKYVSVATYDELRAYQGRSSTVYVSGYLVTPAPSGIAGTFVRDDADTTSADNGGTLIVAANGTRWKRSYVGPVVPQWWDAKGDGVEDDYQALSAMFATEKPWYIPRTQGGYRTSATLTVKADGECNGVIVPDASIGAAPIKTDRFAVIVADSGYADKRKISGLMVAGSVALRAAGVMGIRNDCPNSMLTGCGGYQLDYGVVVRAYSVTLEKGNAFQCNTNLSAYARDYAHEINALVIDGGNYDSPINASMNLGDRNWPDAMAPGNAHGTDVSVINGASMDGGECIADNLIGLTVEKTYSETSSTGVLWRLGGTADGSLRGVRMRGNFWKSGEFAVKCDTAVEGLSVRENNVVGISVNEVFLTSDIYGVDYAPGLQVGCFDIGQPVRLAFRSLPLANITFSNFTLEHENLIKGVQDCIEQPRKWYPRAWLRNATTRTLNTSSDVGAFYTNPAIGKAGVLNGILFTFTTKSDARYFNGGDRISMASAPGQGVYVRSVDYKAGTMVIEGGSAPNGSTTVRQDEPGFTINP